MQYKHYVNLSSEELLEKFYEVYEEAFESSCRDKLLGEMLNKPNLSLFLALDEEVIVGFKLGHERKAEHYYSWLGGVRLDYRGRGIASKLMELQHQFCLENGYKSIQTRTKNQFRSMLILNLKSGFDIIGTYTDAKGDPKIIMEKKF